MPGSLSSPSSIPLPAALSPESPYELQVKRFFPKGVKRGHEAELEVKKITGLVWGTPMEKATLGPGNFKPHGHL